MVVIVQTNTRESQKHGAFRKHLFLFENIVQVLHCHSQSMGEHANRKSGLLVQIPVVKFFFRFVYILVHIFPCSVRISVLHYVV